MTSGRIAAEIKQTPDVDAALAQIEKGQQLAGHFPDADAMDRVRRVLEGSLTLEQANAEICAKYGIPE